MAVRVPPRIVYQKLFAKGKVVNLGCGENPAGLPGTQVDLDVYNHPDFVQADLHNLPFEDKEYDVAIMGDVLEHLVDPLRAIMEAGRVAKKVVLTVYEETRLSTGQYGNTPGSYSDGDTRTALQLQKNTLKRMGFDSHEAYMKSLPTHEGKLVAVTPDDDICHHPHIWEFDDRKMLELLEKTGMKLLIFKKFQEGKYDDGTPQYNWLVVLEGK